MNLNLICKKAKSIVPFLLLFVGLSTQAQSVILSGKIVDTNQKPLAGASIVIRELKKGSSTDVDGDFKIKVPKGTYELEVSYVGFNTIKKEVSTENQNIVLVLRSKDNVLDEVLVSAVRVKADAPVTHSNLTKKEIEKRNLGQDIPILMNYLPNVISSSDAGAGIGYTYMRVRGSDGSRVNVTINGIPYNDAESQGTFWVNMGDFASSTQSLQLQRGVGTSSNGSGAFGASLNILTDAVSEEAGGEISNSFGSYGTRKHTIKYTTGKLNDHFEISGRVSNIYSDGYVDRAFTDLKSYFFQGSYTDENTLIKALVFGGKEKTYQAWYGTPRARIDNDTEGVEDFITNNGLSNNEAENLRNSDRRYNFYTYDNETDNYQQDHYQLHWNEQINNLWTINLGLNYTRGKGYFEQFKAGESASDFNNLIVDNSDVIVRRWLDNHFSVINFNTTYKTDKLEIVSGISNAWYTNDHYGEVIWGSDLAPNTSIRNRYYFSDAAKNDFSIFSKATFNLTDDLKAFVDLQGRFVNYKTKGLTSSRTPIDVDTNFNFFNPKLGLSYKLDENNNFYTSYARANREPNRTDFENGTSTPESLNDYELGWRYTSDNIKLNTNVYFMDYQNQLVLTGAIDDVGAPIRATSGSSYRLGLEIDADIKLTDFLAVRPNIAVSKNSNTNFFAPINGELTNLGDTPLSNSPNVVLGNALVLQLSEHFNINLLSKYVGEQYMGNLGGEVSDTEKLKGYFTSDLNIVYEINTQSIFKSIILTGLVNNIFNNEYVDRGYYYTYDYDVKDNSGNVTGTATGDGAGYYPQATINFLAGITLKF